jgi:RNA polymerase sigma factor for flagellar operon FliA
LSALGPNRDELVAHYWPLLRKIASSLFSQRYFDGIPFEEYLQMGAVGLLQALDRYDPAQGAKFETYAQHRIKGAIVSGLEKATEVNQQVVTLRRLARERIESLTDTERDSLSQNESSLRGAPFDRLVEVSLGLAVSFMLDDSGLFRSGEGTCWDNGESNLAYKQLLQKLQAALSALSDKERAVLNSHYFQHESFDLIAQRLALTKGRVSQLHRNALLKLRESLTVHSLGRLEG